ncbi:MAG: acetyl-CoA carboxylase biotin carboxyl carrier protein [Pseudomonadota bacterium]
MDSDKINQLIILLNKNNLSEIEFSEGDQTIRIKRELTPLSVSHNSLPTSTSSTSPSVALAQKESVLGHQVCSPMVGTVYLAPSPNAAPFVEIGQTVKVGDVLCIVEAMKMMNQIESDKAGVIKARLVENGTPVEFNQPLFVIA